MKRIIIFTLSLLVAVGLSTRIWYVNTHVDPQFTPPKTEIYQMGEWVELDGDFQFSADESTKGYAVKLENIEFMSPKDYAARYGLELSAFYSLDDTLPEFVADLTLNFRNTGNDEGYIQFVYYRIYSKKDLRSFYPLADVNALLHPEMSDKLGFKIYPGTESGPNHFCLISAVEATGAVTGNSKNFPKYLQISMTPTRKVIEIPELNIS